MDLADCKFIRQVVIEEWGAEVFRKIRPSLILSCESPLKTYRMNLLSARSISLDSTFKCSTSSKRVRMNNIKNRLLALPP
jgi:hypothetical protein